VFRLIPLPNTLNEIDGWLEPVEADLLASAAIKAKLGEVPSWAKSSDFVSPVGNLQIAVKQLYYLL
jgi:hypothetical protein